MASLGTVAYFINQSQSNNVTSINTDDRKFAYPDKNDIGKIILQRVNSKPIVFEYKSGKWYVNEKLVGEFKISPLLKGITSSRVEHLPQKAGIPIINESLEKNGINVRVYNKKGIEVRNYDIGRDSKNDRCTYFLMKGSKQPYCMNVSGFGSMRSRFVQPIDNWRDIALFRVEPADISNLKVEYNKDYTNSFEIKNNNGTFEVEDIGSKTQGAQIDKKKLEIYLSNFQELYGEGYDNDYIYRDSIATLVPFMTVTLTKTDGDKKSIKLYPVSEMIDPNDEASSVEDALAQSKYYVHLSTGDFMVAQQKLLQPIMRPFDYFVKE